MMTVQLRFHSPFELWQFKETVQVKSVEIRTSEQVLIGEMEESAVRLAQQRYKAEVMYTDNEVNSQPPATNP
ncbi:MAG TPA: hypothetical protein VGN63_22355 [Flavisolibacter sp.]|jgi:hypothetical protein|nr:hypothetical protein [Flavisolibacter sp.]